MFDAFFSTTWAWLSAHFTFLVLFGLLGQSLFMMRFLAQWLHSEKMGRSAVPEIFWLFSMGGGIVLLIYAILKNDVVFIIGQALGLFIYARNIFFIHKSNILRHASDTTELLQNLSNETNALCAKGNQLTPLELKAAAEALQLLRKG